MEHLIGKRILVAKSGGYRSEQTIEEFKILEISPSKQWVKIMDDCGRKYWKSYSSVTPIEILVDKEKYPEK